MFAPRTEWNLAPNRITRLLRARLASGLPVIDLTESNPTRCKFAYPGREILAWLAQPESLLYEPHPKGQPRAREAVAAYYGDKGVKIDPEQIILTASTSEAYSFLFRLLASPGDSILVPRPSYPLLDFLAQLSDLRLASYKLIYDDGWRIDIDSLRSAITPDARAIVAVSPNNPTGSLLQRDELSALLELCGKYDIALICDEVFSDYLFAPRPKYVKTVAGTTEALTFTLSGLSKTVGMPQLKLAWIVASGPEDLLKEALLRLEIISDTFLSVNAPVQIALPLLLGNLHRVREQILNRTITNRRYLLERLSGSRTCQGLESEGGWYAILRAHDIGDEEDFAIKLLGDEGVLIHPGYLFDFDAEGYLVLSLLPPEDVFSEGVERLVARLIRR